MIRGWGLSAVLCPTPIVGGATETHESVGEVAVAAEEEQPVRCEQRREALSLVRRSLRVVCPLLVLAALTGCGADAAEPASEGTPLASGVPSVSTSWPATIPSAIPPLEGTISTVMDDSGARARIFYSQLTLEQIERYLDLLDDEGFHVQFIVYESRSGGEVDDAETLADCDAIDMTKDEYHMRLEFGGGTGVLDVDLPTGAGATTAAPDAPVTPAFAAPADATEPLAPVVEWPAEIAADVPPVPGGTISSVASVNPGGYHIVCEATGDDVVSAYVQMLCERGFNQRQRVDNEDGKMAIVTLEGKGYALTVVRTSAGLVVVQISSRTESAAD